MAFLAVGIVAWFLAGFFARGFYRYGVAHKGRTLKRRHEIVGFLLFCLGLPGFLMVLTNAMMEEGDKVRIRFLF